MNDKVKVGAAVVTTAVVVGGGGAIAAGKSRSNDGGSGGTAPMAAPSFAGAPRAGGGSLQAAADYLGLSLADLQTQLQAGKTLAQVASAQGKSVSGLEDALVADAKSKLDAAVAAGNLTADQEGAILSDLKSHIDDLVNGTMPHHGGGPGPGAGGGHGLDAAASYLGLTTDELRTQLQAGKTLAQIATGQGKSVSGLEDAMLADAKAQLDAAVAAGTLTSDRESAMLSDLKSHIDDLVNGTAPSRGSFGPPPVSSATTA